MLTDDERAEIDAELARYPDRRAACVDALKIVQRRRRWVSDEALTDVAKHLGMSAHELDGVATFYNLVFRKPVGEHVVLMCNSISCWLMGCDALAAQLRKKLGVDFGQTTPDDRFTLLPTVCLGACDRAPALMIDDDLDGPVSAEQLDALLDHYPSRGSG
jgi:NADH-quinone oxidoreductase subunit E